jgi:Flp pilus assembly protein TadG
MHLIPVSSVRKTTQRGASIVIFTMMAALVVLPLVGLAIDGSIVFWAKARLSAGVDAASLAAGRNINVYSTVAQNSGPVATVAQDWFFANFPAGWMGATISGPNIQYLATSSSTQQVTVSASATIPLYFLRLVGQNSVTLSASAQSSRRNTFVVLVLDRSGSMAMGTDPCPIMKTDAVNFVNKFTDNFDSMALVTFSSTAGPNPDFGPSRTFKAGMTTAINSISCTGATSTAQALAIAYNTIKSQQLAGGLNVIVLFTDGQPNLLSATYPIKTSIDTRYGVNPPPDSSQYTSLYTWPASPCNTGSSTLVGGLTTLYDSSVSYGVQGYTGGLFDTATQVPVSTSANLISARNCKFTQSGDQYVRGDVAYIPTQDNYSNYTNSGYGGNSPYYGPGLGTTNVPATFTSGPYTGQIRPDEQTVGIMAAAINAADYQAQVILNDTTYKPVIYTIGLGGAVDMPIDATLLERIANDQRSPIYNNSLKTGLYVPSPTPTQLTQAFDLVAGQILRLSQ